MPPNSLKSPDDQESKPKSHDVSPWMYLTEGTALAATLLLGFFGGYKLDMWRGTLPVFTLLFSAVGMAVGLYNFLKRAQKK